MANQKINRYLRAIKSTKSKLKTYSEKYARKIQLTLGSVDR